MEEPLRHKELIPYQPIVTTKEIKIGDGTIVFPVGSTGVYMGKDASLKGCYVLKMDSPKQSIIVTRDCFEEQA